MPVVVVATMKAKPESVDAVRDACKQAIEAVHQEPGCELYALHEADGTFVFVEQWADADALKTHSTAPAIGALFGTVGEHLDGAPDIKMLQPVVAGDPAKGQLAPDERCARKRGTMVARGQGRVHHRRRPRSGPRGSGPAGVRRRQHHRGRHLRPDRVGSLPDGHPRRSRRRRSSSSRTPARESWRGRPTFAIAQHCAPRCRPGSTNSADWTSSSPMRASRRWQSGERRLARRRSTSTSPACTTPSMSAIAPLVEQGDGGAIVLTSSAAGLVGIGGDDAGSLGYTAAKHGVVGLMRAYANHLARTVSGSTPSIRPA